MLCYSQPAFPFYSSSLSLKKSVFFEVECNDARERDRDRDREREKGGKRVEGERIWNVYTSHEMYEK